MKSERFEMRLDAGTAERVDLWRSKQSDFPSRAEAFRRLIDVGLTVTNSGEVYPSNSEKLIMYMLCEMMKKNGVDDEINPSFIEEVIIGGHYWALGWEFSGIFHNHIDAPMAVREVTNIMDMWSFIEEALEALPEDEKSKIEQDDQVASISFSGFDGNEESEHMGIAGFMVKKLDRFNRFKDHPTNFNSHWPTLDRYKRMYEKFEPIRANLIGRQMSILELKTVLAINV